MNNSKTILIIEHDQDISEILEYVLTSEGYNVEVITDIRQIDAALNKKHDLVVLDEWLNDKRHETLCHYIKSKSQLKDVPLILSSTNPNLQEIADECKAEAVLERPFDVTYLLDLIAFQLYGFNAS